MNYNEGKTIRSTIWLGGPAGENTCVVVSLDMVAAQLSYRGRVLIFNILNLSAPIPKWHGGARACVMMTTTVQKSHKNFVIQIFFPNVMSLFTCWTWGVLIIIFPIFDPPPTNTLFSHINISYEVPPPTHTLIF